MNAEELDPDNVQQDESERKYFMHFLSRKIVVSKFTKVSKIDQFRNSPKL